MSNMRKYRNELKYTITKSDAEILKQRLSLLMDVDSNGKEGYFIRSLYFDTPSSSAYYEKLDGVLYRKKYRIRMYNLDDKFIRLEKKMKHNNMTSKDQTKITKELCQNIIEGRNFDYKSNDKLLNEFLFEVKHKGLKPAVIVDYYRMAYTYPISDVRITFDYDIKSGIYNYNIFDKNIISKSVIDNNLLVLEVKFNEVLPDAIKMILKTIPTCRQAFSKFAACRAIK